MEKTRRWRHVKRGTIYAEVGRGIFQIVGDTSIADEQAVVVYRGDDGKLWVRSEHEFEDGRFEEVSYESRSTTNPADRVFQSLVIASVMWVARHMDQWEKFKFDTEHGPIFVTISMDDQYPDSFDLVDRETGRMIKPAGI